MRTLTTRLFFENLESSEDSQMHGTHMQKHLIEATYEGAQSGRHYHRARLSPRLEKVYFAHI